ncbi:glycosyltransferase [Butyrivibrio sp. NC2007]|uniref:glycosyltransferase n=1 Tax=Butyrivibrio sp. NC2007 TaxID=1280683 RepID=UPI000417003E|nr:glycosyltransferase [Butyrivibrio sp. NC2007]
MPSENPTFKEKTFVTAGRLQYQKAHWHLIRAFSKIVKDIPEAQLVIFGEGELKDMLMDLIKAYKMEGNVFLNGWM